MVNLQISFGYLPNMTPIVLENTYSYSIILLLTTIFIFVPNKQIKTFPGN